MKKRNIFKPISPKKVAVLLSASLLMLPLTACREKNVEKPHIEIEFCDTSDIKLDTYLNNYVEDYENGKIHNGTEMYNYYEELFEILSQEEIVPTEENQNMNLENSNITYNFNKELMPYEKKEDSCYYANDEIIKKVYDSLGFIELKTNDGTIRINKDEASYVITNIDEKNLIETVLQYNQDGSYKVTEKTDSRSDTIEFNKGGLLKTSTNI